MTQLHVKGGTLQPGDFVTFKKVFADGKFFEGYGSLEHVNRSLDRQGNVLVTVKFLGMDGWVILDDTTEIGLYE